MKYIIGIFMLMAVSTVANAQHQGHTIPPKQQQSPTKVGYVCPMHPEVQSNNPGKCPKCGMNLEKKTGKPKVKPAAKTTPKTPASKPFLKDRIADSSGKERRDTTMPLHQHHEHIPEPPDTPATFSGRVDMQPGKTVRYELYITDTLVNYTGKTKHAYAINGVIPGPDLVFTEGDTAEIYLHNLLKKEETSLHWHGVILPNRFDGVPYLTTAPVHPGDVHLYKFAIQQNGTYWYHSHSGLQEQAGIYGALIFKKREGQESTEVRMPPGDHTMHPMPATDTSEKMNRDMHTMPGMDHGSSHMPMRALPATGDGSYNREQTVVLSEWTDELPYQVQRRLRTGNDWYAIKKGSTQSYAEAIKAGHFNTKVTNEWKRMNAMDVSDVYYNRFLINGNADSSAPHFKKGDRVRLRIVNAGGSSYFWVGYGGGKMTVIGNDGNEVAPIEVDRLIVGVSETYDVVVTIPDNKQYEFRATPEDRTGAASLWLGSGTKMPAPVLPRLQYFEGMKMMNSMMKMNGDMKMMEMEMTLQKMDMNTVMYEELKSPPAEMERTDSSGSAHMPGMHGMNAGTGSITTLNYAMLQSPVKTMLPPVPYKELNFELTGNMNRYVWSINNKVIREWDKILIEKGQNVRIILFNNSMMRHPMHLHGHDFRVLNGQGDFAPLKNVLDIMPMETDTIEFAGSQDGDWFFHCHILYHMMAGMGNVFSYKNALPNPELPDKVASYNKFLRHEQMLHPMAEIGLESNGSDGMLMLSGERYELRAEWRIGLKSEHGNEVEASFGRYLGKMQWWFPFIGFDYHKNSMRNESEKNVLGQLSNQNNRRTIVAGIEYTLPMLIKAQARIDGKGKFRVQLGRDDIPLTSRLRLAAMWNTDKEYMAGFKYILRKWLALSTHYDSDMGYGAGVTIIY